MSQAVKDDLKNARSPFDDFEMDESRAQKGIHVPYNGYYFGVAYSGVENPAFGKALDEMLAPIRAAFPDLKTSDDQYVNTVKRCFCRHLVTTWGSDAHGKGKMIGIDKEAVSFTADNVEKLLMDPKLAKLTDQLMSVSSNYQRFLKSANEQDAKN